MVAAHYKSHSPQRPAAIQDSFIWVVFLSIGLHLVVFVIVPVLSGLFRSDKKFERPQTFQLIAAPTPKAAPRATPKPPAPQKTSPPPQEKPPPRPKQAVPAKTPPPPKQQKEENLDELEELLSSIPVPTQISLSNSFNYPWYIRNLEQKIRQFWNPGIEDKDISVRVSFSISEDGSVHNINIQESSGNSLLDNQAERAIKRATPFGKLPPGFKENQLDLAIHFYPIRK